MVGGVSVQDAVQIRIHDAPGGPTLIYLPGLHGDWTLLTRFRRALGGRVRFVEITYPRWTTNSLEQQALAVKQALLGAGIAGGWLLAESFGSQIAWPLAGMAGTELRLDGIVLAGGFVRHPFIAGVRIAAFLGGAVPVGLLRGAMGFVLTLMRLRYLRDPESRLGLKEFAVRRTAEDRAAAVHRLRLIAGTDLRGVARNLGLPVFHLTGLFDPIVPWPPVRSWIRENCPGWKGSRVLLACDHPVLTTRPAASAAIILEWVRAGNAS